MCIYIYRIFVFIIIFLCIVFVILSLVSDNVLFVLFCEKNINKKFKKKKKKL